MESSAECRSVADLQEYYRRKTREISAGTALMAKFSDISTISDEDRQMLNEICSDLGKVQKLLSVLKTEKEKLKHVIECDRVTLARLEIVKEKLLEQKENIPKHMPVSTSAEVTSPVEQPQTEPEAAVPAKQQSVRFEKPAPPTRPTSSLKPPNKTKKQKLSKKTHVPVINFLTTEEFKSLPKYMVGRLKYEQINSLIEELNTVTVSKYKIIDTPLNKLSSENMRRFNRMTEKPETKDTAGMIWFEAQDIKDFSSASTVPHTFNKMVALLRHCHRLRQVRAGKIERYVVIE